MGKKFKRIGVMAKPSVPNIRDTVQRLLTYLQKNKLSIQVEYSCAEALELQGFDTTPKDQMGKKIDLLIVVGGDGSLLNAARTVVQDGVPVIGINRGRLGFLTDISPEDMERKLDRVLEGEFKEERRRMLQATVIREQAVITSAIALNDVVLYPGEIARMIEFEIWVDDTFVCAQRSDGLITATPTGSTAYALSGGGPILHPTLDALVLVPMHPHTLTSRPLVIDGTARIELRVLPDCDHEPLVSCDGQIHLRTNYEDIIRIERLPTELRLIHPVDHDFFTTLRNKLSWSAKTT